MNQQGVKKNSNVSGKRQRTGLRVTLVLVGVLILGLVVGTIGYLTASPALNDSTKAPGLVQIVDVSRGGSAPKIVPFESGPFLENKELRVFRGQDNFSDELIAVNKDDNGGTARWRAKVVDGSDCELNDSSVSCSGQSVDLETGELSGEPDSSSSANYPYDSMTPPFLNELDESGIELHVDGFEVYATKDYDVLWKKNISEDDLKLNGFLTTNPSVIVSNGTYILGSEDGLTSNKLSDDSQLWQINVPEGSSLTSWVTDGQRIFIVDSKGNLSEFDLAKTDSNNEKVKEEAKARAEAEKGKQLSLEKVTQHELVLPEGCIDFQKSMDSSISDRGTFKDGVMEGNSGVEIKHSVPVDVEGESHLAIQFECTTETGSTFVAVYGADGSKLSDIGISNFTAAPPVARFDLKMMEPADGGIRMRWGSVRTNGDGPLPDTMYLLEASAEAESVLSWNGEAFVQDVDNTTVYLPNGESIKLPTTSEAHELLEQISVGNLDDERFSGKLSQSMEEGTDKGEGAPRVMPIKHDPRFKKSLYVYGCGLKLADGIGISNAKIDTRDYFSYGGFPSSSSKKTNASSEDYWVACAYGTDEKPRDVGYGYLLFDGEKLPALYAVGLV